MLIDANIFLEVLLNQTHAISAFTLLERIGKGDGEAFVSDFTIDSVLLVMHNHKASSSEMNNFLLQIINSKGMTVYSVTLHDRIQALKHIEKYGLDYEDALVLQSAISTKSEQIVSFDTDFDVVKEIERVEP